jgi:hypothetical protein
MSIAQFESLYTTAVAAFDGGDYAGAIAAATKAQLLLGTSPNLSRALGSGNQSIGWNDGSSISLFITNCRTLQRAATAAVSGVFAQSKVTYSRATQVDDYT